MWSKTKVCCWKTTSHTVCYIETFGRFFALKRNNRGANYRSAIEALTVINKQFHTQGWGPRGLASTSRTKVCGLGLGLDHVVLEHIHGHTLKIPLSYFVTACITKLPTKTFSSGITRNEPTWVGLNDRDREDDRARYETTQEDPSTSMSAR